MVINNIDWLIMFVQSGSPFLTRSDGSVTLGMTDGWTKTIYLDDNLRGLMLDRVLAHELVHAFMFSYDIHIDIEFEEYIADWISLFGRDLVYLLDNLMQKLR